MKERLDMPSDSQTSSLLVDRRNYVRIQVHMRASIAGPDEVFYDAMIIDISTHGAQIQTPHIDLANVSSYTVRFRLGHEYQFTAESAWQQIRGGQLSIGIQWTSPAPDEGETLMREIMRIAVSRRRLHV